MNVPIRLAAAPLLAILLGGAAGAHGAQITVTMKDDVVADDGRCSLREAIDAANTDSPSGGKPGECVAGERVPVVDVILLRRGTYRLKRGGPGDDLNVGGDLDVTESVIIEGKGQRGTVIQSGIGDPAVPGDGDRLFHVDPGAVGGIDVTFSKLTLARGDVSCSGAGCDPGGSAVDQRGAGSLTFENAIVMRSASTCTGEECGTYFSGGAITSVAGGAVTIRGTTIKKNSTTCASRNCVAGPAAIAVVLGGAALDGTRAATVLGNVTIDDSEILQNSSSCVGPGCGAIGIVQAGGTKVAVRATDVSFNASGCTGSVCATAGIVSLYGEDSATGEGVDVSDNEVGCSENDCFAGSTFVVAGRAAALYQARLRANPAACDGSDCRVASRHLVQGLRAAADGIEVRDHAAACAGARCEIDPLVQLEADGPLDVADVLLSGNEVGCEADACEAGTALAWYGTPLRTARNEVASNAMRCTGARCELRPLLHARGSGDASVATLEVSENLVSCTGDGCRADDAIAIVAESGDLELSAPVVASNGYFCTGAGCSVADLLDADAGETLEVREPEVASNQVSCQGDGCSSGGVGILQAGTDLLLGDGFVGQNSTYCSGSGCRGVAVLRVRASDATVEGMTFTRNQVRCDGEDCGTGTGGALRNQSARMRVRTSELSFNATDGFGGAIFNDAGRELVLENAALFRNEAGLRGVMEFGGFGGAIYNDAANGVQGSLQLVNTTVRENRSLRQGGGLLNEGTLAPLVSSTIADNLPSNCVDLSGGTGCP